MLRNFFKSTIRNFWKNRGYSVLNISGLAIGIACASLIFLWVESEKTYDNVHLKKDRLYGVEVNGFYSGGMFTMESTPRIMGSSMKHDIQGIVNYSRVSDQDQRVLFSFDDKKIYATGRYADTSIFSMLTLPFVQGNARNVFSQLYAVVISESAAKKVFGTSVNVIGKTVRIDNKHDLVVSGVMKDIPANSSLQVEWLAPYDIVMAEIYARTGNHNEEVAWDSYGPLTYIELDPKANPEAINKQLEGYIHSKNSKEKSTAFLFPMSNWRLFSDFNNGKPTGGGRITQVRLLSGIAWIILLIACINFMNLATANSQNRAKEVGVRKVLGAAKRGLITQFMGEAFVMSALAAIIALGIVAMSLPAFNSLMQAQLILGLNNPVHIGGLILITAVCGLIAGSYPSLYLSSFKPILVLKGLKMSTGGASLIRKGLVVVQFVVSVVFIISTMVVYMQIRHIKGRNLGFDKDNLIEINPQQDISKIFPLIRADLMQTGYFQNVALADHTTLYGGDTDNGFKWQGKSPDNDVSIAHRNVSPEYVSTSGMQIIDGRDFRTGGVPETSSVIINESMAKLMGKEGVIGAIIQTARENPDGKYVNKTVIGIVRDYVYGNVFGKAGPLMIFCAPPEYAAYIYVRLKPQGDMSQALAKIAAIMKKDNPAYPPEYRFVDEQFNRMFQNETLINEVSTIFALLAIAISCLGLFGLAAYTAEQRKKEIGIRKVLGASVAGLASLLSADFLKLVGISCLIAFPLGGWIMHNWLQSYEYRIGLSWWIFAAAGIFAVVIALGTISFQTIKAAVVNPVKSLRSE